MDENNLIKDKTLTLQENNASVHYRFIGVEIDIQDTISSLFESTTLNTTISFKILPTPDK